MDIPNYPGQTKEVAPGTRSVPQSSALVSLEQLNLTPDKLVRAIVTDASTSTGNNTSFQAAPAKNSLLQNEWILNINGKSLLISTSVPLEVGQTLMLKLGPTQELLIQTKPLAEAPTATRDLANNKLDSHAISTLLKAVNQVLPRQVSLEHGFAELNKVTTGNSETPAKQQAKILIEILRRHLPQIPPPATSSGEQTELESPAQSQPKQAITASLAINSLANSAEQAIKPAPVLNTDMLVSAIKNSGLFFEQSINRGLIKPSTLTADTLPIQDTLARLQPASGQQSFKPLSNDEALPSSVTYHPNTTTKPNNQGTGTTTDLSSRLKQAFSIPPQKAGLEQAAVNRASSSLSTFTDNSSPNQTIQSNAAPQKITMDDDLKGALFKASAALTGLSPNAANRSEQSQPGSYVDALTQVELLKTPFNFPHLIFDPNQHHIQKASAILSDQELNTGQLLKLIAGMLNRIQFNQLNSLYQSHSNSSDSVSVQSLFLELPVIAPSHGLNTFSLRIDKEEDNSSPDEQDATKTQPVWRIALSFDLDSLGAIYVQANLFNTSVSSVIWADKTETLNLISREMPYFRQRLALTGLEVGDICCQKGLPRQNKTKLEQSLVDIKA